MREVFYEETVLNRDESSQKIKYNLCKWFSVFFYCLLAVWIGIVFWLFAFAGNIVLDLIFSIVPLAIFFCLGLFLWKAKNKYCVDYDYTFVSGSVRFSKVIKGIRRIFITKFESTDVEKLGKYGSETYKKYSLMKDVSEVILTSNTTVTEGKGFYYLVVNKNALKYLYVLECTETFIVNLLKFTNKGVLDQEYLNEIAKS